MNSPAPASAPSSQLALLSLRVALLPALAASMALTIEYRSADSSFCAPASGCAALRQTDIAYLWGLGPTLPEVGLFAFAAVFALSLSGSRVVAAWLSIVGGVLGLLFLVAQATTLQTFCWLCTVVDLSAMAAGVAGALFLTSERRASRASAPPARRAPQLRPAAWAGLAALAVIGPALWPVVKPSPPVPAVIRGYYRPDKINVIEFADYECPFCRRLHQQLKELLAPYGERVHFVRLNMPLPRHTLARDAALAAICAESSGRAEAFSDFLFTTNDLSVDAIRAEAKRMGMDLGRFDACRAAPATLQRLERESRILDEIGFQGLPTTYIGDRRIVGAQSSEVFQDALDSAAEQSSQPGVPAWAYVLVMGAIAFALVHLGRTGGSAAKPAAT